MSRACRRLAVLTFMTYMTFMVPVVSVSGAAITTIDEIAIAPEESRVILRMGAAGEHDVRWRDVVIEMLGMNVPNAERGWSRASGLVDRLGIASAERLHAIDTTGSQWIHAARWSNAAKLQSRLRRAETRPLRSGRFVFAGPRIDLALARR